METGEFQASPDINARIEDTIPVPLEPGEFLHVSTSRRQFGDFFKEYAYFLGFNGNEAKQFFDNNVNLTFSPIDHRELDLPLTDIERKFWMQVSRIKYGLMREQPQAVGETLRLRSGKYMLRIDPQRAAHGITFDYMGGKLTEKYSNLPKEARIATLKDYFSFIAMHELRHVLQAVRNPEKWNELDRKKVALSRTILGITASSPIALTSEMAALGWAGATFGLIGFHAVLRPLPDLEKDPEDAVKEADLEKIKRRPFNFEIETDPQPQI